MALRRTLFGLCVLPALLALPGCVSAPPPVAGALFTGRLQVRSDGTDSQPARSMSGGFELSGGPLVGQMLLTSPLGTVVARARWQRHSATAPAADDLIELDTGNGVRRYDSLDALMVEALGDNLPLAALFDWLAGRPWPQAAVEREADGLHFSQLGWSVDCSQLASAQRLEAQRAFPLPALHVKVRLDAAPTPVEAAR